MNAKIFRVSSLSLHLMRRQKLFSLSAFALIAVLLASALAAEFGGRQPATVALDVGLSTLRLVLPLFLVFLVQDLFSREFERKFYQVSLSYPVSRRDWLIGRFLALMGVSLALLFLIAIALAIQVTIIGQGYAQPTPVALGVPYWITIAFIGLDLLVLTCLACFLAVVAVTPSFVLIGTLGFMLIARSYSTVLALLSSDVNVVEHSEAYRANLGLLGYLLPDLGALDVRMITLYGHMEFLPADWPALAASALLYALGFIGLSLWLFNRKQFA